MTSQPSSLLVEGEGQEAKERSLCCFTVDNDAGREILDVTDVEPFPPSVITCVAADRGDEGVVINVAQQRSRRKMSQQWWQYPPWRSLFLNCFIAFSVVSNGST